jgi:hypothetical protein
MNTKAPHIYGTIKLHRQGKPIRQIVNWIHSPAYKLTKHLNTILTKMLQLPNAFNVQNTSTVTHSLKLIKISKDIQICSFDIENMYTSTPINELLNVIENIMNKNYNISQETKTKIKYLLNTILNKTKLNITANSLNKMTALPRQHHLQQF